MAAFRPAGSDSDPAAGGEGRRRGGALRRHRGRRAGNPEDSVLLGGGALGAFGEMLIIGLVVSILALPLVTLVPALAAGSAHFQRHLAARGDTLRVLLSDFWLALRTGWWLVGLMALALLALIANGLVGLSGALPFGRPYGYLSLALAVLVAVVVLRTAGAWASARETGGAPADPAQWRALVSRSLEDVLADPGGTGILLLALLATGFLVWMLAPLAVIVPGMLVIAIVAVQRRAAAWAAHGGDAGRPGR